VHLHDKVYTNEYPFVHTPHNSADTTNPAPTNIPDTTGN
jgi:hypothetical protein